MLDAPELSVEEWHQRFSQQARWTAEVRRFVFNTFDFKTAHRLLEVGCGTGVITSDIGKQSFAEVHGLDIQFNFLEKAYNHNPASKYTCGNVYSLPYPDNCFDGIFCHFLLLWLKEPQKGIREIHRALQPGGHFIIFAEPDYAGRIDFPHSLRKLGSMQRSALSLQGTDPDIGSRLAGLLIDAGFIDVRIGLLGGQWGEVPSKDFLESEWKMLEADLKGMLDGEELTRLRKIDQEAWRKGERVIFVPTFYAWGKLP